MKTRAFFLSLFLLLLLLFPSVGSVLATADAFSFDPTTVTTESGQTFTIKVTVDPGTAAIKGAEAFITYDSSVLQMQSIDDGKLFTLFHQDSVAGKLYMAGLADTDAGVVSTAGTLGTITFKALTDGQATLEFYCDAANKKGSSIIQNDASNTNIVNCGANGTSGITVGSGVSSTTPTPIPTDTQTTPAVSEPTPASLPRSGVFDNVVKSAIPGAVLLILGSLLRLVL